MVNWDLYKVFYTVARCGSLTRAAEELYISQPAVSQAIRTLEAQLKMPLFKRTHKGMELTAQGGMLVYDDVSKAVHILGGVEDRLAELNNSATGTLRVGASETIFQYCIADKLVDYHKKYPNVKFELLSDISPRTIEQLKTDRCDIGFLNLPVEEDDGIVLTDTIMLLSDIFVAGEAFSELKGKKLTVRDLQSYPLLLMEEKTVARSSFDHFCNSMGVTLHPTVEVDSWGFMKRLVVKGMGIGCIPREYTLNKLHDGSLFELDVSPEMPFRSVGMALPKNANISFALRAFMAQFPHK